MKKKILIIEDDNILRKAIKHSLRDAGFDVLSAVDGEDGFRQIKSKEPDLVLLDLILPNMQGEQVLKKMKENSLIKKIPVIVLSCKSEQANIANCLDSLGANGYLIKSHYSLSDIVDKINKTIRPVA